MEHIREIFSRETIFPMRNAWIVLSESNFSRRSRVVLYPAVFRAANISILYLIGTKSPPPEGVAFLSTPTVHIISQQLHGNKCNIAQLNTRLLV